ncbi:MAG: DUF5330 domain-containing protein [Pseudolabrys sp.]|nr:DUF5330 domain-containing protein [Pseudolabrys sp.]
MFFLLRVAFWLAVVCVLLASGRGQPAAPDAQFDAAEAVTFASAAVSDARGFCDRRPDACVAGGKVASALGRKAEAGARMIYEFLVGRLAATRDAPAAAPAQVVRAADHGTLSASDREAPWRASVPLPPRRDPRPGKPSA